MYRHVVNNLCIRKHDLVKKKIDLPEVLTAYKIFKFEHMQNLNTILMPL